MFKKLKKGGYSPFFCCLEKLPDRKFKVCFVSNHIVGGDRQGVFEERAAAPFPGVWFLGEVGDECVVDCKRIG